MNSISVENMHVRVEVEWDVVRDEVLKGSICQVKLLSNNSMRFASHRQHNETTSQLCCLTI